MHVGLGELDTFFEGHPPCLLPDALQIDATLAPAAGNLFLATVALSNGRAGQIGPKRFFTMLPDVRASDFEYIVFDMAPLNQSGGTLAIAGLMDKVLFVVEAERDNRDLVKRVYAELVGAKANVSAVLNKCRCYGPQWLGV
jgi:hypothetical protein